MNTRLWSAILSCLLLSVLLSTACVGVDDYWEPSPDIDAAGYLRVLPSAEYHRLVDARATGPAELIVRVGDALEMKVRGLAGVTVAPEDLDRYHDPFEDYPDEDFDCFWKVYDRDNNVIAESTGDAFQYTPVTEDVDRGPIRIRWFAQDGGIHTSATYPGWGNEGLPESANDEDLYNDYLISVVGTDIDTDSNNDGTIEQSDDPIEENYPGKYIELNIDDNNANEVPDKDDTDAVTGEDDLAEVRLAYSPTTGVDGCKIVLVASQGTDKIKVWKSPTKVVGDEITVSGSGTTFIIGTDTVPSTVYAEGILAGTAMLDLVLRQADDTEICRDRVVFTVRDTTGPYFFGFLANPPAAKQDDAVTLTFQASEDLAANPTVAVNGHAASYVSNTGRSYTYSYTVQSTSIDPPGPATIVASGTDTTSPGNEGSSTNTTALFIYADGACSIAKYTYDKCGKRRTMCDSRGVSIFSYDEADRLSSVRDPDGESIAYEYDPNGRRIGMVDHDAGETAYTYYDNGWIHTITDRDEGTTTFEFHPDGMVQKITYPNGAYTEYNFDTSGGLSSLTNKLADGTVLASFGFYYQTTDDNGNSWPGQILVTQVDEQVRLPDPNPNNLMASATIHYAYDDQYRVVRERRVGDLPFDRNYGYDAVGNRSSLITKDSQGNVTSTTSYTHDEIGRILTRGSVTFDYDFDDLTMTRTEGANVRRYSFSPEGNLIRVEDGQDVVAQFTYDGLGRRTSFTDLDGITRSARFDLDSIIAEESIEGTTHYLLDELGLLYGASDSETRRYYHFNDMGDTTALTTAGPTVTEQWAATYDTFGVISLIDAESLNALNAARALHSSRILAFSDPDQPFQGGGQGGDYTPPGAGGANLNGAGGSGGNPSDDAGNWICWPPPLPPGPSCPPGMVCLAGILDPCWRRDILWPGLATGGMAVVNAFTFGKIGPGKWGQEPGYRGARILAEVGREAAVMAGTLFLGGIVQAGAQGYGSVMIGNAADVDRAVEMGSRLGRLNLPTFFRLRLPAFVEQTPVLRRLGGYFYGSTYSWTANKVFLRVASSYGTIEAITRPFRGPMGPTYTKEIAWLIRTGRFWQVGW